MKYHAYEMAHAFMSPLRMASRWTRMSLDLPLNPLSQTLVARNLSAACQVFEDVTTRYGKPEFGLSSTSLHGLDVPVREEVVLAKPFCNLLHFSRDRAVIGNRSDPKVLIVAPMSGHYATLLRGTVKAMLPEHEVYITDWADARMVPVTEGRFDLDDFIEYVMSFVRFLGPNTNVIAVCQPSVPVLAATAVMAAAGDECQPATLTLMGGPIDTRRNPTVVNKLAAEKPIDWFERNVISYVPYPNPGFMRQVYPGFIQLTGFMTMNLDRHTDAHMNLFNNLVKGDCDSVRQHKKFYEEYMAVMDLTAEFYLQTVETVFQRHALPNREMLYRGNPVDCKAIEKTALITIEGENDDICGLGQTEAAHDLCSNVPIDERYHYVQRGVGHYGVFNGTRFRTEIQPRIREMIRTIQFKRRTGSSKSAVALPYRTLGDERETAIDWRAPPAPAPKPNGKAGAAKSSGKSASKGTDKSSAAKHDA